MTETQMHGHPLPRDQRDRDQGEPMCDDVNIPLEDSLPRQIPLQCQNCQGVYRLCAYGVCAELLDAVESAGKKDHWYL